MASVKKTKRTIKARNSKSKRALDNDESGYDSNNDNGPATKKKPIKKSTSRA